MHQLRPLPVEDPQRAAAVGAEGAFRLQFLLARGAAVGNGVVASVGWGGALALDRDVGRGGGRGGGGWYMGRKGMLVGCAGWELLGGSKS